ncbi:MAG TPA: hypothetical protein VJ743_21805 [Albitalea sp.]|nr:hypothetical protein [Albitalea sp.]
MVFSIGLKGRCAADAAQAVDTQPAHDWMQARRLTSRKAAT